MKFDFGSLDKPFEAHWPVTVSEPVDGGKVKESRFIAKFRLLPKEEYDRLAGERPSGVDALIRAFFIGMGGEDAEAFSPAMVELMLERPYIQTAIFSAYQSFSMGIAPKN